MQQSPEATHAMSQIKAVYDDGYAEINGRRYDYHRMTHLDRRAVFAFFSTIQEQAQAGEYGYLDSPTFAKVEALMARACSCDGLILDKAAGWWDEHPEDYLIWVVTSLAVISCPFFPAGRTGSTEAALRPEKAPLRKPMSERA